MAKRSRRQSRRGDRLISNVWLRLLGWTVVVYLAVVLLIVAPLRIVNPPVTAFMLQQQAAGERQYHWVPLDAMSPQIVLAVIASEDQRFLVHNGVDIGAIQQALDEDGGAVRGASTLTQQLVKNLYLWPGRSLVRKGIEAGLALAFEAMMPKPRILELYLNVVEFGPGIYGVGAASEIFFGKAPSQLTASEAALLVTVLPNPAVYRVRAPSENMVARQRWVLGQMARLGEEGLVARLVGSE